MLCGSGAGSRFLRQAMRTAYRSTKSGFHVGSGGKNGHHGETPMDAQSVRLRKLAPKKRSKFFGRKKRHSGRARY